jgi:hypothetical protein
MNLEVKSKVDFTDAHLWADGSSFTIYMRFHQLPLFYMAMAIFDATIQNHLLFEAELPHLIFIAVTFVPNVMATPATCDNIMLLLKIAGDEELKCVFHHDGWGVTLDSHGEIIDRFPLDYE